MNKQSPMDSACSTYLGSFHAVSAKRQFLQCFYLRQLVDFFDILDRIAVKIQNLQFRKLAEHLSNRRIGLVKMTHLTQFYESLSRVPTLQKCVYRKMPLKGTIYLIG